eukprot:ANDGO_06486.mRNA.1 hypothetical protein CAOG_06565
MDDRQGSVDPLLVAVDSEENCQQRLQEHNYELERTVFNLTRDIHAHKSAISTLAQTVRLLSTEVNEAYFACGESMSAKLVLDRYFPNGVSFDSVRRISSRVGVLEKKGRNRKNWTVRYVCISNHCLVYYKKKEDAMPTGVVRLVGCKVFEVPEEEVDKPLTFCIEVPGGRKLFCASEERTNMMEWIYAITEASDLVPKEVRKLMQGPLNASSTATSSTDSLGASSFAGQSITP